MILLLNEASVRAHTNIALIKYWGKKDDDLIIPMNSSLSLTLDAFYTETSVEFDQTLVADIFFLDGEKQDALADEKLQTVLNEVRKKANITDFARVTSKNFVPTAAGLASSASGLAALAGAASIAAGLTLSEKELSRLARRGSGSASRSIYGGFVEWQAGDSDETSYAKKVRDADFGVGMVFLLVNKEKKAVSSRVGMKRTVETSPYYDQWVKTAKQDLADMKDALAEENINKIGELTERSAMKMHATTLAANPPFTYWESETLDAMQFVYDLREEGIPAYFTMDAGPNVKIFCRLKDMSLIQERASKLFGEENCVVSKPGIGLSVIQENTEPKKTIPYDQWLVKEANNAKID